MSYRYAVLGSGRQGTAAAFDMGRFGEADGIWLLDSDLAQAEKAATRVNDLLGRRLARAAQAVSEAALEQQSLLGEEGNPILGP